MGMTNEQAANALAASAIERAHDLIQDGWTKGTLYRKEGGAPVSFCILGALEVAFGEMFGGHAVGGYSLSHYGSIFEMAQAFILDEAMEQFRFNTKSIPGFNDAANRTQEQVLSVLRAAANRLWNLSVEQEDIVGFNPRTFTPSYTELEPEQAKQYLSAVLA